MQVQTNFHTIILILHIIFFVKNELNIVADGQVTLDTFCQYQQTVNPPGDNDPLHFDYAILITGYDHRNFIMVYGTRAS